ncbi:MAG: Omp28-related outer membrane protein [Prevotella sp.]|jgi:hypothetical protein
MKKLYLTLLALCCLTSGFADDISLGYCDGGQVESSLSGATKVAVGFPPEEFPMYEGSTIIGVRIGVNSDVMAGVKVFLRSSLDGDNLYTMTTPTLYQGWNDVYFDETIAYPAGDLYVGYDVSDAVSPGVSGTTTSNSCYTYINGTWKDQTADGVQPLCVELLISGDSYTHNDAGLISVNPLTVSADKQFNFTGVIRNNTNQVLSSVRMSYDLGDGPQEADATVNDVIPGETGTFSLPAMAGAVGEYTANLNIISVAGQADEYDFNNSASGELKVVGEVVPRKVLLEEFTGLRCSNCPSGHARLELALKNETDYIEVAHHWGFGTDDLTATGSTEYTWFYNSDNTFAPGMMIDRRTWSDEYGLQTNGGEEGSPVFVVPQAELIQVLMDEAKKQEAEAAVTIKRNYDAASRQLTICVGVKQIAGMTIGDDPVLTIDLIENGIHAAQAGSTDENYEHNNVNRMFVTDPMGDPVNLSTDDYTYATYTVNMSEDWNVDNMNIVAFVSNYNKQDCNDCNVYNAEEVTLNGNDDIPSYISQPTAANNASVIAIYNASGVRMQQMQRGLNIVKFSDGTTRKVVKP